MYQSIRRLECISLYAYLKLFYLGRFAIDCFNIKDLFAKHVIRGISFDMINKYDPKCQC